MNQHPVVAIDGPSASGKSTVARHLAAALEGFAYVDTGAMYRTVTREVLRSGVALTDPAAIVAWLPSLGLECRIEKGASRLYVKGEAVLPETLRAPEVAAGVSHVAKVPEVRTLLVAMQRSLRAVAPLVMEGRDIGTVVFSETPFKFFLDASPEVRASRRHVQGEQDSITQRDMMDSTRAVAPLKPAEDAEVVDSSNMTVDQVVAYILERVRPRLSAQ
jgi:cytidylate kinase